MQRLYNHLRSYIEIYFALVAAAVTFLMGILGNVEIDILISIVSFVLGIIAISIFRDRHKLEELKLHMLPHSKLRVRSRLDDEVNEVLYGSMNEVYLILRYGDTIRYQVHRLSEKKIKVYMLLCDPDDVGTMKNIAFRTSTTHHKENGAEIIRHTITEFSDIENLEIRLIPYGPTSIVYMSDPKQPHGELLALYGAFRVRHNIAPTLRLRRFEDESTFSFFYEDFVRMWKIAKPISGFAEENNQKVED